MVDVLRLDCDDAEALTVLYEEYGWWSDRSVGDVRAALQQTDVAVGLESDGSLVAAARVLTDETFYAMVYDVIVAADRRGEGLGRVLMDEITSAPECRDVGELALMCRRGLVPFYEDVGFERFDMEAPLPDGTDERLVRMTYPTDS